MKPALLLVDLQQDFLARAGLEPDPVGLVAAAEELLVAFRARGIPVLHAQTIVRADGGDRMPHWVRNDVWACVEGTSGAAPPAALAPRPGESVHRKRFFSAFEDPSLLERLLRLGVDTLVVAGVYLQTCVRATVRDAYAQGFRVWVAEDAVGTTEPVHAELGRAHLARRAADFLGTDALLRRLGGGSRRGLVAESSDGGDAVAGGDPGHGAPAIPVACLDGVWRPGDGEVALRHRDPCASDVVLSTVPRAGAAVVDAAVASVAAAWPTWAHTPTAERAAGLERWAALLVERGDALATELALHVGKPIREAHEEVQRAVEHVRMAVRLVAGGTSEPITADVIVRHRPVGVVAALTPWNNPIALPAGKLAPALAFGNGIVWKPAPEGAGPAHALLASLHAAEVPPGLVALVHGDAATGRALAMHSGVAAVTVTGSTATGRSLAALCAERGVPLQAELGGNNAVVVLEDAEPAAVAGDIARAAFGFAGQRCTAPRRIIAVGEALVPLRDALVVATEALRLGDPRDIDTDVGPLVSVGHRDRVREVIQRAESLGARRLCGGDVPEALAHGAWLRPCLLEVERRDAAIVQRETFGPVAVLQHAADLDAAIELVNAVPQGLLATLCSNDDVAWARFAEGVEVGLLARGVGALRICAEAPFGGWKASGIGPPEHGVWDRQFASRPQAVYAPDSRGHGETA